VKPISDSATNQISTVLPAGLRRALLDRAKADGVPYGALVRQGIAALLGTDLDGNPIKRGRK